MEVRIETLAGVAAEPPLLQALGKATRLRKDQHETDLSRAGWD